MPNRRNVLIGLGGLVAGGGALIGTGAFSTVEAERTVNVQTADDANAFLGITAARDSASYVTETDGTVQIDLDGTDSDAGGLNENARTRFENLVQLQNNGEQEVTSLTLEVEVTGTTDNAPHEEAFKITTENDYTLNPTSGNPVDLLGSDANNDYYSSGNGTLTSGNTVTFGVEIDLLNNENISEIADDASFTLTIGAETSGSN
ncbi:hypothetical protein [Halorubrum sp. AJ67]|uniref:hypothetical protein n=1 Tax=Halorubrum sp. AJ67 TaxID=1173487 RepID=UPI0003DB87FC|nr:hypothetical protein [Halorubrum sp. AJ67]CDK39294.1 uncharacterized protein BN903_68 [Halorubrum sp. AJ67]